MPGTTEMIVRMLLAALLGSVVGLERERLLWVAGLRTHMLVCVGSALFMLVSAYGFGQALGSEGRELDVSRVAAQVVSGIGFLGAGTILLRHDVIRGLTTAASLWAVAAIGLAVGGGMYVLAVASTTIILGILVVLRPLERVIHRNFRTTRTIVVDVDPELLNSESVQDVIAFGNLQIRQWQTVSAPEESHLRLVFVLTTTSADDLTRLLGTLRSMRGVISAELK